MSNNPAVDIEETEPANFNEPKKGPNQVPDPEPEQEPQEEMPVKATPPVFRIPQPKIETHAGEFDPKRVRCMVYGESGSGKTVFAATWNEPIFLDLDDGMASITHPVARIGISGWQELQEAYMYLKFSEHKFKTVVVDSLNESQWHSMQNVINNFPAIRRSYDNLPSMSDYGKALDDFDKFVRVMRALPMNVVFIAQLAKRDDPEEMARPQFTGKATAENIARMMDVIGFLYKMDSTDPIKPRIMTFDDSRYVVKDRSGKLPTQIINPTYAKLAEYWK